LWHLGGEIGEASTMRIFLVPLMAYALAPVEKLSEPNESAMRIAFEASLQAQVQNVMEFLEETAGPEAVARIRDAGTDRFEIRKLSKIDCARDDEAYRCNFAVDISVINGVIEKTVTGRFVSGPDQRLTFIQDI
jgi:hypothetical protein